MRGPVSVVRATVVVDVAAPVPAADVSRGAAHVHARGGITRNGWTLHDLRHTAAYRMARDPEMPLADVILSFRVSHVSDLRRPVVDSVADGTHAA